jgi:NAD(P)-dependent dehydrogenase (short-subunit alcohol dehydrogenase family)
MKIAITGHTKGIGKAVADLYYTDEVVGFSRSNGYDITHPGNVSRIIAESADCDIFVNNAYYDFVQCDLLEGIFKHWRDDPTKTIVNIISRARYGLGKAKFYGQTKMELYSKAKTMMFSDKRCRIININPGYVETDMTSNVHGEYNMLTPEQLAKMIKWCLDQPQGVEVGELSVWCTTLY